MAYELRDALSFVVEEWPQRHASELDRLKVQGAVTGSIAPGFSALRQQWIHLASCAIAVSSLPGVGGSTGFHLFHFSDIS